MSGCVCVQREESGIMEETENFWNVSKIHNLMFSQKHQYYLDSVLDQCEYKL